MSQSGAVADVYSGAGVPGYSLGDRGSFTRVFWDISPMPGIRAGCC